MNERLSFSLTLTITIMNVNREITYCEIKNKKKLPVLLLSSRPTKKKLTVIDLVTITTQLWYFTVILTYYVSYVLRVFLAAVFITTYFQGPNIALLFFKIKFLEYYWSIIFVQLLCREIIIIFGDDWHDMGGAIISVKRSKTKQRKQGEQTAGLMINRWSRNTMFDTKRLFFVKNTGFN